MEFSPDELTGEYDRLCSVMDHFPWYQDQELLELINNCVPATCKRGLDIGCGTGIALRYLAEKQNVVRWIGIDVASEMVAKAKLKCERLRNIAIQEMDWKDLRREFEPNGFDFILLKNVLHLITDIAAHLAMLPTLLSATGRIMLVETISPNAESKRFVGGLALVLDKLGIKKHIFTARDLARTIRQAGLDVQKVQYHEQFIEITRWVDAKAHSEKIGLEALTYLQGAMRSDSLRTSMKYEPPVGSFSGKMLRRQILIQCVPKFDGEAAKK
jgi:ubiquinone/menaquinone biosynthesis C-methylase UbiE